MSRRGGSPVPVGAVALLALSLLTPVASAQQGYTPDLDEYRRRLYVTSDVLARAREVMPRRRDEPLRDINISDEEIREIQLLVRDVLPRAIVNVGPVVTGCPCEEGRSCTEQVHIQANSTTQSVGLLLSRTRNSWNISQVQKWWLRWHAFEAIRDQLPFREKEEREWQLVQDFPVCTREAPTAENAQVPPSAEPRK